MAVLSIDPPMSDLTITNAVPATEDFTATLTYPDGTTKDVTADSAFTFNSLAGDFNNTRTLTVKGSGKFTVTGVYTDKQGSAQVIVHSTGIRIDPTLPPNAPDLFGGAEDPARAPNVVYPPADVVMPRNLGDFETHWTDANGNDIFEISLHTDRPTSRLRSGRQRQSSCGSRGIVVRVPRRRVAGGGRQQATVTYQVRGVQSANPGAGRRERSAAREADERGDERRHLLLGERRHESPEGIWRHDMAKPGQPAEQFMTKAQTGGRCIACHVLSRDGKNMLVT